MTRLNYIPRISYFVIQEVGGVLAGLIAACIKRAKWKALQTVVQMATAAKPAIGAPIIQNTIKMKVFGFRRAVMVRMKLSIRSQT